jgi:CRP-like cAMP-binding protein
MHVDLLELPYFDGISMDGLVSIVDLMAPVQFEAGAVIVPQGVAPPPLFIATHGRVLITKRAPDGKERSLAELQSPTLFGEIELFCQIPAVCTAKAVTPVSAFSLDRPTYDRLFASCHPGIMQFTFNVARVACHRLAIADEMLAQVLDGEDLIKLRASVWGKRDDKQRDWANTTGAFERPARLDDPSGGNSKG